MPLPDRTRLAPGLVELVIAVDTRRPGRSRCNWPDALADVRPCDPASNRTSPPAVLSRQMADRRGHKPSIFRCRSCPWPGPAPSCHRHEGARPPGHGPRRGAGAAPAPCTPTPPLGHSRQRDRHAFERIALALPVQRLMLAKFLEHDHGQKTGTGPSPRYGMEGRRRLADLLAVPAAELLADRFDHLPLPGYALQRPVTSSPSLRRRVPPQQAQLAGGSITTRSRGRCSGKVWRSGRLRVNPWT